MKRRFPTGRNSASRSRSGFSLVMTIAILSLMAMIAIGLLSLSTVTVRSANTASALAEARANARLALMLALGELQKQAGSDRRVTASAAILDDAPDTSTIEGVNHPHWVGTWDSWTAGEEAHGDDDPSEHTTITRASNGGMHPSYAENREDHFRAWLVSLSNRQASDLGTARNVALEGAVAPVRGANAVRLVAEGSLGEKAPDTDFVSAGLLELGTGKVGATAPTGRYAWWVADESTKARIMSDPFRAGGGLSIANLIAQAQGAGSTGHDAIEGLSKLNDQDLLRKTYTRPSLTLAAGGDPEVRRAFHSTTPWSYGVLADVREGGLKRDLNALLEQPINDRLTRDSHMLYRFDTRGEERVPIQDLAAYYQLYREHVDYVGRNSRNPDARRVMGINNVDFTPGSSFKRQYTALYRMPVPIKLQFLLSYIGKTRRPDANGPNRDRYKMHIGITPAVTLWNPYNIPLVLNHGPEKSTQIRFFNLPIALKWRKEGDGGSYQSRRPTSLSWIANRNRYGGDRYTGFELFVGGQNPIIFEPGEVRVFSLKQTSFIGGAAVIEDSNQYREVREVDPGWDPTKWLELPRSDRNGDARHVEQEGRLNQNNNTNDDGQGGPLTFNASDKISFTVSAADNVDLANGAALQFFFRQSSVVKSGEGGSGDNKWMRRQYQMISRMYPRGARGSQEAIDFQTELMSRGFPEGRDEIEFPEISGSEIAGQTKPFLLVSLTAGCEVSHVTAGDARGRRFPSRPFLHASPIHACPFVDRNDYDSFYHHAWNWWVQDINSVLEASVQVDPQNRSFHGGGYSPDFGTTHLIQQEIPLTPLHSIAALSHARLGGYSLANNPLGPGAGETNVSYQNVTATGANGLFPHVLQAIGNSYAHPYLKPDEAVTQWTRHYSQAGGQRNITMVDHSYLANKALWDEYFFSSIAPHNVEIFDRGERLSARDLATRAFEGEGELPNRRLVPYRPNLTGKETRTFFSGAVTNATGAEQLASRLMVKGPFNVNSTSVDAWRALFSSLRGKSVAVLDPTDAVDGGINIKPEQSDGAPVAGFSLANGKPIEGSSDDPADRDQWTSWRELSDDEIDELAEAIVKQVKRRGPFLSLSEFVNRRLDGRNKDLALKGALQAALDDEDVSINEGFSDPGGDRVFSGEELDLLNPEFPEAMAGPIAYGSAAYIDQADILRNFGAQLTPRGDTFVIRTYGDALDKQGNVKARAWCEAVVQRVPELLDRMPNEPQSSRDKLHTKHDDLQSNTNRTFGRPFRIVSFRWLASEEV